MGEYTYYRGAGSVGLNINTMQHIIDQTKLLLSEWVSGGDFKCEILESCNEEGD